MVWGRIVHQTIQIHEFEYPWLTQHYISKALRHMARQTLQIQLFSMCLLFSNVFRFSIFPGFQCFPCLSVFQCFPCFQCFPLMAFPRSVAGARLTAFPEVRFMRCAVHGSNLNTMRVPAQLSEKPSYQRWTRLQPMLETLTKSEYDRALAPSEF